MHGIIINSVALGIELTTKHESLVKNSPQFCEIVSYPLKWGPNKRARLQQ